MRGAGPGASGAHGEADRNAGAAGPRPAPGADRQDDLSLRAQDSGSRDPSAGGEVDRSAGPAGPRPAAAADRREDRSRRAPGAGPGASGAGGEADRSAGPAGAYYHLVVTGLGGDGRRSGRV